MNPSGTRRQITQPRPRISATLTARLLRATAFTFLLPSLAHAAIQASTSAVPPLTQDEAQALVKQVLQVELQSAQSAPLEHPMQYRLRKTSPRYSSTKLIIETKDGDVARLLEVNNAPLSSEAQQAESTRLQSLYDDPSLQRHRQEREQGDSERARKIMRALPDAFLYQYAGLVDTPHGPSYRLTFQPNPRFDPEDIEAQALKGMAGELWIDAAQHRVTRLQGRRIHDVDYGWGIVGKLDEGGTLLLEQSDIGNHQWRTTHLVLVMNARLLIKSVKLDTTLELTNYTPVPAGIPYQQAIQTLRAVDPPLPPPTPSAK